MGTSLVIRSQPLLLKPLRQLSGYRFWWHLEIEKSSDFFLHLLGTRPSVVAPTLLLFAPITQQPLEFRDLIAAGKPCLLRLYAFVHLGMDERLQHGERVHVAERIGV